MNRKPTPVELPVVSVERLVPGGAGMGRLADGRAIFVAGGLPGDRVEIEELKDKKSYVNATRFRVIEDGPERIPPACPEAARCGGCDWMVLSPSAQLAGKKAIIEQALERTGRFRLEDLSAPIYVAPPPSPTQYRSRVRLQIKDGRVGFFTRDSHHLVEIERCLVSSPKLWKAVTLVREVVRGNRGAFDRASHVEVRVFGHGPTEELSPTHSSAHFVFAPSGREPREASQAARRAVAELEPFMQVRLGGDASSPQAYEPYPGVRVYSGPGGFTQVNEEVNRSLVRRVLEEAGRSGAKTFLDLYCGSGNFALPLVAQGLVGVGVERATEAILWARKAASDQNLSAEFFDEASETYVRRAKREGRYFDMAVLDPPRSGALGLLPDLLDLAPPLVLMVSCDPVTLARDLRILVDGGYQLRSVEGFDMFPQTHHVESLAVLSR